MPDVASLGSPADLMATSALQLFAGSERRVAMSQARLERVSRSLTRRLPRRSALRGLASGAAGMAAALGGATLLRQRAAAQESTPAAGGAAFVALRSYHLRPDRTMDELAAMVGEGFVPIISKIPGFREYMLVDAGDGAFFSVSVFADEAGADASTTNAADWVKANVAELIEGPPEVTEGSLRVHATGAAEPETV